MLREFYLLPLLVTLALGAVIPRIQLDDQWGGRIVGGANAAVNQIPHQCSLRSADLVHFCGCSILSNRWVLSAAQCTFGRTSQNTRVTVGTISRTTGGISHNSIRIVNHPNYNPNILINDVSVVQTATVITITPSVVQTIALRAAPVGVITATVSGWGQTSHPGEAATTLQFLAVITTTNEECRRHHSPSNAALILDSSLCAGGNMYQGACMGDAGGPLFIAGDLIGIVSWGIACGRGIPDVYSRISFFRDWIISITV